MKDVQVLNSAQAYNDILKGGRPVINRKTGLVHVTTPRGMRVNSLLRKDEWESLDAAVVEAARDRLIGIADLRAAGLVKREGFGVLESQYNQVSEMTAASVNMSGRTDTESDRVEFDLQGVPLPIISKTYEIGERELAASRALGGGIDTTHAFAASAVLAEQLEDFLFEGYSAVNFNGKTIYGYTTHPNRTADTATNFGGGDWGTVANPVGTVAGMINAAHLDNHYGPYMVYAATTQYNQARNSFYTDGSGDTPYDRIKRLSGIIDMKPSDRIGDGEIVLVQMTRDVVDLAEVPGYQQLNLEWTSGDGMTGFFRIVTIAVPRVKSTYGSKSGVVHATGA